VFFFFDLRFGVCSQLVWIRSFGLMLGLINKPRLVSKEWKDGKEIVKQHITTILLVPHRDLAFQLYRIVDRITKTLPKTRVASIAYVLVRGTGIPIPKQILRLEAMPPHILICTPKALLDVYRQKSEALKLSTLSTVAVEEVDYLIEALPRKKPGKSFKQAHEKAKKKVARNPGLARQFLDLVYCSRRDQWSKQRYSSEPTDGEKSKKTPQLIIISATLHVPLKDFFFEQSGWLDKDNLVKIIKNDERKKSDVKKVKKSGDSEVTGERGTVLHSVLVVAEGEPKNVVGARVAPELKWTKGEEGAEAEIDERYDESKQRRI
jgi:superfamily II DNA/RNA helicase